MAIKSFFQDVFACLPATAGVDDFAVFEVQWAQPMIEFAGIDQGLGAAEPCR